MAKGLGDDLGLGPSQQHQAGEGVTEVVEPDPPQTGSLGDPGEVVGQVAGVYRPALDVGEDQIAPLFLAGLGLGPGFSFSPGPRSLLPCHQTRCDGSPLVRRQLSLWPTTFDSRANEPFHQTRVELLVRPPLPSWSAEGGGFLRCVSTLPPSGRRQARGEWLSGAGRPPLSATPWRSPLCQRNARSHASLSHGLGPLTSPRPSSR